MRTKPYYVEGPQWFVVRATKARAKMIGVREFGRGRVRVVRPATEAEVDEYVACKGKAAMEDNE